MYELKEIALYISISTVIANVFVPLFLLWLYVWYARRHPMYTTGSTLVSARQAKEQKETLYCDRSCEHYDAEEERECRCGCGIPK